MAATTYEDPIPEARDALTRLREQLEGTLLERTDDDYERARTVHTSTVDGYPLAIAQATSVSDIPPVLEAARTTGLPLAVRGGGHSIAGLGTVDDGIVLDLGALRDVEVDPEQELVTVGPGARVADVDAATAPHGIAVPLGVVSTPGIAGLTLGGGVGWLTRRAGLAVDRLERAEVVTATGEQLVASRTEHPDLFWGLRGGGGNFGVVSSFTFRAVRLPGTVLGATLFHRPAQWRQALAAFERWSVDLPDEITSILTFLVMPAQFGIGEEPWLMIRCAYVGDDPALGAMLLERLQRAVPPEGQTVGPVHWPQWQSELDGLFPHGARGMWRNVAFDSLDEDALDAVLEVAMHLPGRGHAIDIHHLGGAFARVPEEATAFPHRAARFWMTIYGFGTETGEGADAREFAQRSYRAMAALSERGEYVNFRALDHTRPVTEFTRHIFGEQKYRRLQRIKQRYDPQNLFRGNYNVSPDR